MHSIRRTAFRAASSPSASFSRSINTSTPFVLRSKTQSAICPSVFKRFASNDANDKKVDSADNEHGSIRSAIDSATESVSTYTAAAAEKVTDTASYAQEAISETAAGAAQAWGGAESRDRQPYNNYRGGDRGARSYGGDRDDRGGFGSKRTLPSDRVLQPTSSIYVGNLLFDVTSADLQREFEQFGPIKSTTIATDARGLSKGFGYVEFQSVAEATAAIEAKHQTILEGRRLVVNYMSRTIREHTENPPSKTLFIGNLAFEMSDSDLNKLFRDIRNVIDVRVAIDRRTGQPRGFAHADFVDVESAVKGKELLTGKEVYGRTLRVDYSGASKQVPDREKANF